MKLVISGFLAVLLNATILCAQQVSDQYKPVLDEAAKAPTLEPNLRKLTDEIGGRVPGTPAMDKAVDWGIAAFKAAGADSVHAEEFTMQTSWSEGNTQVAVTAPIQFAVRAVSIAWSPNMDGITRVVDVGSGSAEEFAKAGDIGGAILLVHSKVLEKWEDLFNEYLDAPPIIDRAVQGKARAIAWTATREHDILYRHINAAPEKFDVIPSVLLAREDAERIARLIASGQQVHMRITLNNRLGGPVKTANVIAELRGSEKPDEWVLMGAHLDSWNLGTGALDNGCDAALVVDALRAIKASGMKPRRSIRFALFSGEEQGMLGSIAYVKAHRAEMANGLAAVVFDTGTGKATGFSLGGRKDIKEKADAMMQPFAAWGANTNTTDAFVGTDNLDFLLEGIPTLVLNQQEANYLVNYHATSDTFDKVDFAELKKNLQIAAYAAAYLADQPGPLGERQTRAEIEQLMKETTLDRQMQLFHQWDSWAAGTRGRSQ